MRVAAMNDLEALARTIWGEARGEGFDGMAAVANVVMNRVHLDLHGDGKPDWWGEGVAGVCLKPWQFSCWNRNDPNREKVLAVTDADERYRDALAIAAAAMRGSLRDRTGGATHYYAPKVVATPAWAAKGTLTAKVGDQLFYRVMG